MSGKNLYTIGFSKKSARVFFDLLMANKVERIIDIRLNNTSQLAGFTKVPDFQYFLQKIASIEYVYLPELAPTKAILNGYKNKSISWSDYEHAYLRLLTDRQPLDGLEPGLFYNGCLLCAEATARYCHRRLAAEYIKELIPDLLIVHL